MIKVSHKELKENQKRKKKQDEEDDEPEDDDKRLTGEQISRMEERELNLMKQLKIDNAKKSKLPDAKFCICQRVAKSVSYIDFCNFQFRSIKISNFHNLVFLLQLNSINSLSSWKIQTAMHISLK